MSASQVLNAHTY